MIDVSPNPTVYLFGRTSADTNYCTSLHTGDDAD